MIQRILAGRYELQENIGGGGMADVYRAYDKLLDRSVAVKILHPQLANDAEFIEKFRNNYFTIKFKCFFRRNFLNIMYCSFFIIIYYLL